MGEQRHAGDEPNINAEMDDWSAENDLSITDDNSTIYKKDSINPAKRRRLEAMREEQELMQDLKDVFDDYDFDE
ncbi:PA3496 family putative envelope integrity protein [Neptuniibacter sp.]|uniref:PA3496 family putative envelope integrity protein n=1 Tax=Neptuniibacter sp. TaxID=1962643 RepID=UPI003B5C5761